MSMESTTAGQPGALRCSELASTPSKTTPKKRLSGSSGLPFVTETTTPRGRHLSTCYFDVPAQDYGWGWTTGARAFLAVLEQLRLGGGAPITYIIKEAVCALAETSKAPSRRGAASGFLWSLDHLMRETAAAATVAVSAPQHYWSVANYIEARCGSSEARMRAASTTSQGAAE